MKNSLSRYVGTPDSSFTWRAAREGRVEHGVCVRELTMTSQTWRSMRWRHAVQVFVPETVESCGTVLLYVTGDDELMAASAARVARNTGCIVAVLYDVPRQPCFGGLREDGLLSYTLQQFLATGDATWPLLLPMVKSVVRAMDALEVFCAEELGHKATGFVVCGGSKRGWTTWLAPAVDGRVKGIAPAVYDNLDLAAQMRHQMEVWGDFSERIQVYTDKGLPQLAASGRIGELLPAVDPAVHLDELTLPKFLIIGTNDRYWPLDALNLYYHRLRGTTHQVYIPNVGHNAMHSEYAVSGLEQFLLRIDGRASTPEFSWHAEAGRGGAELAMETDAPSPTLRLWRAHAPRRDFREARWECTDVESTRVPIATDGAPYTAAFGELEWDDDGARRFLSTNVYLLEGNELIGAPEDEGR